MLSSIFLKKCKNVTTLWVYNLAKEIKILYTYTCLYIIGYASSALPKRNRQILWVTNDFQSEIENFKDILTLAVRMAWLTAYFFFFFLICISRPVYKIHSFASDKIKSWTTGGEGIFPDPVTMTTRSWLVAGKLCHQGEKFSFPWVHSWH